MDTIMRPKHDIYWSSGSWQCAVMQQDTSVSAGHAASNIRVKIISVHTTTHHHNPEGHDKVKVKVSLCFNWVLCHEDVLGEWRYSSTHSLTLALNGGEWSASRPGRFSPRETAPGTHWTGGWVGPRAILDVVVKRNPQPLLGIKS
jgi:hypothetical protein